MDTNVLDIQTMALDLPGFLYRRLQRLSELTHRPVESLVLQSLDTNIPPALAELPESLRADLADMENMPAERLWQIAQSTFEATQQAEHSKLVSKQQTGKMSNVEKSRYDELVRLADRHMLRKAFATALLKFRGLPIPPLPDLQTTTR